MPAGEEGGTLWDLREDEQQRSPCIRCYDVLEVKGTRLTIPCAWSAENRIDERTAQLQRPLFFFDEAPAWMIEVLVSSGSEEMVRPIGEVIVERGRNPKTD